VQIENKYNNIHTHNMKWNGLIENLSGHLKCLHYCFTSLNYLTTPNCMGEMRNAYIILAGKAEGKRPYWDFGTNG
jgi:hypothetical protein